MPNPRHRPTAPRNRPSQASPTASRRDARPGVVAVHSRNDVYQQLQSLRDNRQRRHSTHTFLVEGVRPINVAVEHGWVIGALIVPSDTRLSSWATALQQQFPAATRYELAPDLMRDLSGRDDGSEVIARVEMREDTLDRIDLAADSLVLILDRPSSPGNLGTLLRSCDAFGVRGVIVLGHAVDVFDPAVITASRGSLFVLPVVRVSSPTALRTWIDNARRTGAVAVVGADETGQQAVSDHQFAGTTALVLGNETTGLSQSCRELCDTLVQIPMVGSASSLNVGVAGSILLYEFRRQVPVSQT